MKKYICEMKPEEVAKLLQEGHTLKDLTTDTEYKMMYGLLYNSDAKSLGNELFLEDDDLYFDIDEPFKITEPGLYKTREGRQVYITYINGLSVSGVIKGCTDIDSWETDGHYFYRNKSEFDIVSKWENE